MPLSVVADIKLDQGPTSINRYDRERQATVAADLVGSAALGDATKKIYELPVMKSLPKGVKVSPSGDAESLSETIRVATTGDVGPALAKFDTGDRLVPIRVQLEDGARGDLQMLEQLRVPLGQRGE